MPANKSKKGYITCRKKLIKQTKKIALLGLELGLQMKKK